MIAVAVVGLALGGIVGGVRLARRRQAFLHRAKLYERVESAARALERRQFLRPGIAEDYAAIARKYHRAARYPWLPVEPDPPEPTE
jgi:hypothetical protein